MKQLYILVLISLLFCLNSSAQTPNQNLKLTETQKIDSLISIIGSLDNAKFVRNGTAYDSKSAASHLQLKLNNSKGSIKTANQFINYIASKSSITRQPYKIRFEDGTEVESKQFLEERLKKLE